MTPEDASTSHPPAADAARDVAEVVEAALGAQVIDDSPLDLLRDGDAAPHTTVTGRVVDEEGKPVSAEIFASTKRTLAGALLDAPVNSGRVQSCRADSNGHWGLAVQQPGVLRIAVRNGGFAPLDLREISLPSGKSFDLGDVHLTHGLVIAGRVLDPERRPLPNAFLSLVSAPLHGPVHRLGASVASPLWSSDESGHFDLPCIPLGKSTLLVRHASFPDAWFEVENRLGQTRIDDLEFVLARGASISGSVLDFDARAMPDLLVIAIPVDGLQLFDASKPEGASAMWLSGVKGEPVDLFGRFLIPGLELGHSYSLGARRKGTWATGADEEIHDRWAPPTIAQAGTEAAEVCYRPGCRLDFEVVDRASGLGLEHLNLRLSGVLIEQPLDELGHLRTSFPGGRVSLIDLRASGPAAPYQPGQERDERTEITLTIEAPGHDSAILEHLRLAPGAPLDLGAVRLDAAPVLEVRVLDAATNQPLPGARVVLTADYPQFVTGRTSSVATTQANGLARLTSLRTTSSTLSVTCPGHARAMVAAPVDVHAGSPLFEVALPASARVTANVHDTRGASLEAALVMLSREASPGRAAWNQSVATDVSGAALFTDMPEGIFTIAAWPRPGFTREGNAEPTAFSSRTLQVRGAEEIVVELEVAPLSSLAGSLWRGREPLAAATISFFSGPYGFDDIGTDLQQFTCRPRLRTDMQGEFSGVELAPGEYTVLIEQAEHDVRTRRVVRVEKMATSVIIDVDDTQVSGSVLDSAGRPVAQARVRLFTAEAGGRTKRRSAPPEFMWPQDADRRSITETTTDGYGEYRLGSVPPGVPLQIVFARGPHAASSENVRATQGSTLEHVDARLPDEGALDIVLSAPAAAEGLHYGVRIAALDQPEGLAIDGAAFGENGRAHFDGLPPGRWMVMVLSLDSAEQVVDRRKTQLVNVLSNQATEFSVGW